LKAIVYHSYGSPDVLKLEDVEKPTPSDDELLIRVRAASVNPLDFHFMRGHTFKMPGQKSPKYKRMGVDVAGEVEAVGKNITQFKVGDAVFGGCGRKGWANGIGSFAEYVCGLEDKLVLMPSNLSFAQASSLPIAACTALQGLRDKGRIQQGQKVLIEGASGGVGTFAVQIAKAFGAEVTAVASTKKLETARLIGADHLIDYTEQDFTRASQRYDLIVGANSHHTIFECRRVLTPNGRYVETGGAFNITKILYAVLLGPLLSRTGGKKTSLFIANINQEDLQFLASLAQTGKIIPVLDRSYPLRETADAIRYLEEGHACGKIVLTVD